MVQREAGRPLPNAMESPRDKKRRSHIKTPRDKKRRSHMETTRDTKRRSHMETTRDTKRRSHMETTRDTKRRSLGALVMIFATVIALVALSGCSGTKTRTIEVTAYCACSQCTDWERGSWKYLKLDFWNHYVSKGPRKGKRHTGQTASGTMPRQPHPGLFSWDTVTHPWKLPFRILFPWLWLAHDGTIAADTKYYAFGTRMHVPGYGYGVVEDRGGAIKGPKRLDLYYDSHKAARKWGRQTVEVEILN